MILLYSYFVFQYKGNFPIHDAARANDVEAIKRLSLKRDLNALNEVITIVVFFLVCSLSNSRSININQTESNKYAQWTITNMVHINLFITRFIRTRF